MLAKTGLAIAAHQAHTVANYLELRSLAPDLPFVPVLQGLGRDDYLGAGMRPSCRCAGEAHVVTNFSLGSPGTLVTLEVVTYGYFWL